jgi:hypothetical protein
MAHDDYLTDAQLADRLHVTTRTTMRWRRDGSGPSYLRVGVRRLLYRQADVESWLANRSFAHRAAEATAA